MNENIFIAFILGAFIGGNVVFWSYGHMLDLIYKVLKKKKLI